MGGKENPPAGRQMEQNKVIFKNIALQDYVKVKAISNLTKIKNPNFKIQIPNEIQMSKCQNIKSARSEIVME